MCTQLGKYFAQSFSYSYAFEAVDEHMNPRETLPLVFGTFFVNTIAPSLNLAGTTLVVDDARRRGIAPGKATSAALLMQITVDSGFATIMLIAFGILAATVGLSPLWFLLGLLVIALVSAMVLILVLGRKRPALVLRALRPIERLVDRVLVRFKKKPLDPWVERIVGSFSDAAGLIAHNPKTTAKAFGCSIAASACELACFSLVGVAFGVHQPEPLICGYVVATLFAMISITPQGVGVVEAAVVVAFTSFGVSGAAGLSIALVYRGIVFWMPFLIGAILIQTTKTFKHDAKRAVRDQKGKGLAPLSPKPVIRSAHPAFLRGLNGKLTTFRCAPCSRMAGCMQRGSGCRTERGDYEKECHRARGHGFRACRRFGACGLLGLFGALGGCGFVRARPVRSGAGGAVDLLQRHAAAGFRRPRQGLQCDERQGSRHRGDQLQPRRRQRPGLRCHRFRAGACGFGGDARRVPVVFRYGVGHRRVSAWWPDLSGYLTEEEKAGFVEGFLEEGDLNGNGSLKVFPVGKSTETLQINMTDFQTSRCHRHFARRDEHH